MLGVPAGNVRFSTGGSTINEQQQKPRRPWPAITGGQSLIQPAMQAPREASASLIPTPSRLIQHSLIIGLLLAVTISTSPLYWKPKVLRSFPLVDTFELRSGPIAPAQESLIKPAAPTTELVNRPRQQPITHKVRYGESLSILAEKYNISIPTIMWANNLTSDIIRPDQELVILPVSGVLHTVEDGDTIETLAALYQTDTGAITTFNQLTDPRLRAGDKLVIPGGRPQVVMTAQAEAAPAAGGTAAAPAKPRAPEPFTYVVKSDDTLAKIAAKFGINVSTILYANDLSNPEVINPGQELTILPVPGVLYTVREGDMLREVADRYGIALASILKANNLDDPSMIITGHDIILPGAVPIRRAVPQTQVAAAPAGGATRSSGGTTARSSGHSGAAALEAAAVPIPVSATAGGRIVAIASKFLGSAYVWGGHSPSGFDCSGFTWYVYQQAGIHIPVHDLWGQVQSGPRVPVSSLEPGDLVFFQNTYKPGLSHSGIYIGGGRFINAVDERGGVTVSNMHDSYWGPRYYGASRPW